MPIELKPKITTLLQQLNVGLVERDATLKAALLTVLAGENLILVGPPGTAKSLIARRIAQALTPHNNNGYFEYLLTKFSTPEEIFGPLSITALKADCFKRNTEGYLPTVQIAFLDEIFKASSSILNALLTILNERAYHNGTQLQKVPMQALIAASNELPTGQEELSALYDRFLLRVFVGYVSQDNLPQLFEKMPELPTLTPFTAEELSLIKNAADAVTIPPNIVQAVLQIWQKHQEAFKEDAREQLSDRRLKKVIKLLSVSAVTNGRSEADLSDVLLLKDCLWNHPDNVAKVREIIFAVLRDFSYPVTSDSDKDDVDAFLQGHTISSQEDEAFSSASFTSHKKPMSAKSVIKGYKGSGTQSDPILIENYNDVARLERADVGQKGYYFRQTVDIDCTQLTTWLNITFQGHYDGGGCVISGNFKMPKLGTFTGIFGNLNNREQNSLFSQIQSQSSITNLRLQNLSLADNANFCQISACTAVGGSLMQQAINCNITACEAEQHLIVNKASQCVITRCKSGCGLLSTATACSISDCLVELDWISNGNGGGIAFNLSQGSSVGQCFVTARKLELSSGSGFQFSGITNVCDESHIENCALGSLKKGSYVYLLARITNEIKGASTLQDNISIDTNSGTSDNQGKGRDGKSVAAARFNQHYFEHTLNWDFATVWQWNNAKGQPELQSVGVGAVVNSAKPSQSSNNDDLLEQQMRANMWL